MKFTASAIIILVSFLFASSSVSVFSDSVAGAFNTNWKNLSEWFLKSSPPTYESQRNATDSAITDWHIREDNGYYRITISQNCARMIFPDSFPWTLEDWNFNAIGTDSLLNRIDPERRINIIFHLLGYPRWLMLPEDTVHPTLWSGWFVGDTKLPIYHGSVDSGLILYSQLITAFCNHYDSMGINFSMTVMAEPNLDSHWSGTWDDANRLYEAFVNGVDASTGGADIKVGGLVWAAGGQYTGSLDSIILWAQYWRNYCITNDVRYDFICYHHYWRSPDWFDTVACAFEEAFPDDEFWITEWNYKFSNFLPYDEYRSYVVGMAGATGNLDFLMRAQKHTSHSVLAHFCVIGAYKDYGICHWRDSTNWDYTASGHMFRWLTNFGDSELTIENNSSSVSVISAAGDRKIDVMLSNYDNSLDTVDFTVNISDADTYYYELWRMNRDSCITSLFFIARIDSSDSSIYWEDTTIQIPVPYLIDSGSNAVGDFIRTFPVDSDEIYYVKIIKNGSTYVQDINSVRNTTIATAVPNPFNSSCIITAPKNSEIAIYDIRGNLICRRGLPTSNTSNSPNDDLSKNRHQEMSPTEYRFIWTPDESVPSGIYFIKAITPDRLSIIERIVYIR